VLVGGVGSLGWRSTHVAAVVRARPHYGLRLLGIAGALAALPTAILGASLPVTVLVVAATAVVWFWAIWRVRGFMVPPGSLQGVLEGLTTERLLLRRPTKDDSTARFATVDAAVVQTDGWRPSDVAAFSRVCRAPQLDPSACVVLITDKASGQVLGELSLVSGEPHRRRCRITWWMGPRYRRQGYGTEAVGATLAALDAAGMREVMIGTRPIDTAVRRVCERLRMVQTSTVPWSFRLPDGRRVGAVWYVHRPGEHPWSGWGLDDPAARGVPSERTDPRGAGEPDEPRALVVPRSGAVRPGLAGLAGLAVAVAGITAAGHTAFAWYKTTQDPTRARADQIGYMLSNSRTQNPASLASVVERAGVDVLQAEDISPCDLDGQQVGCVTILVRLEGEPHGLAALSEPDIRVACWRYTMRNSIHDHEPSKAHCPR
jgi:RimJ/RimL family protein N-acetyltransferase